MTHPVTATPNSPLAFQLGPYANEPGIQRGTFSGEVTVYPNEHVHLHVVREDGSRLVVHPWEVVGGWA